MRGVPDKSIKLATIGKRSNTFGSKVPPVLGSSSLAFDTQAPAFAAELARLEIDPDTGEVTLHEFVVAQDVGRGDQSARHRGPDARWRRPEPWLCAQRRPAVRRAGPADEPEFARLPQADRRRPAQYRDDSCRGARAGRPVRRARRRRATHRARPRRDRQRYRGCHRTTAGRAPAHARKNSPRSCRRSERNTQVAHDSRVGQRMRACVARTSTGRGSLQPPAASRCSARKLAARSFPRRPPAAWSGAESATARRFDAA